MNLTTDTTTSKSSHIVAIVCALLVTGALLAGYLAIRARRSQERASAATVQQTPLKNLTIELQIFEDEADTKGSQAIIGGTVRNFSNRTLSDLVIEMEFVRRDDGGKETRPVKVEPNVLTAGGQGKYQIKLPAREWSGARLIRVVGGERREEIGYKSEEGTPRPLATPNVARSKSNEPQSRPRRPGDDFYNTPDSAEVIR
ncbi:MAG: hypothetical protein H0V27_00655 [Pyrinomonadaceae bacterium]|nr:hypothetical protein [Pyrinomonadaceae bacterium]